MQTQTIIPDPLLVLIEYVPCGDLLGYLRKSRGLNDTYFKDPDIKPQTSLTSQQLIKFAWQIADGMSYLSSRFVRNSCCIAILLHNLEYCFEIKIILYPRQQVNRVTIRWSTEMGYFSMTSFTPMYFSVNKN